MALIPCRECGAQISTSAKYCPQCGAKPRSAIGTIAIAGVGFAIVLFVTFSVVFSVVSSYQ